MTDAPKNIASVDLKREVEILIGSGCRLVQISCTKLPDGRIEINYSFGLVHNLVNFRMTVRADEPVPSVSDLCWPAALYENEMHDLFGLNITGLAVDYHGAFYRVAKSAPFLSVQPPSVPVPGAGPQTPAKT